ncbi:MAG: hypothetical protein EXS51_00950 [Candidatus Taylorbacteria bacterium]|nr:hypothetical protein [Candidatus Taylorbacteria bacterium]
MAKISTKHIAEAIYHVAKGKSGGELDRALGSAVEMLSKSRLLSKAPEILGRLEEIQNKDLGIVSAEVTSRSILTKETLADIRKTLKARYNASDITLKTHEDQSLIGGIKIEANGEIIDLSLRNKLSQLQSYLLHHHV